MKKLILFVLCFMASLPLFAAKQPRIVIPLNSEYDSYWYYWTGSGDLMYLGHLDTRGENAAWFEAPNPESDTQQGWLWIGAFDDVRKRWVYSAWHYVGGTPTNEIVRDIGPQSFVDWWNQF